MSVRFVMIVTGITTIPTGCIHHQLTSANHEVSGVVNGISARNAGVMANGYVLIRMKHIDLPVLMMTILEEVPDKLAGNIAYMMRVTTFANITVLTVIIFVKTMTDGRDIQGLHLHLVPNHDQDHHSHEKSGQLVFVRLRRRVLLHICLCLTLWQSL